jgi:hypothetical protein
VAEAGIRQFLDIGTGIPTSPNVHQVAQSIAPAARIVYADNEPLAAGHAAAGRHRRRRDERRRGLPLRRRRTHLKVLADQRG